MRRGSASRWNAWTRSREGSSEGSEAGRESEKEEFQFVGSVAHEARVTEDGSKGTGLVCRLVTEADTLSLLKLAMHPALDRYRVCRLRDAAERAWRSGDAEAKWALEDYTEEDFKSVHGRWPTDEELQALVTPKQLETLVRSVTGSCADGGIVYHCQL